MSNFKCSECGMVNIDCGKEGYKTPKELQYEKALEEIEGIAKNFGSYAAWQEQRINKILDIISRAKGKNEGF